MCFFGIVESDFWTPEARELFEECVGFVSDGQEGPEEPQCIDDLDCGEDSFSELFCMDGDVHQTVTINSCAEEMCIMNDTDMLVESCEFGCEQGACLSEPQGEIECFDDLDCPEDFLGGEFCAEGTTTDEHSVYQLLTDYSCVDPGTEDSECVAIVSQILIEECSFGCDAGMCMESEGQEGMHDIALIDFINSTGMIRIEERVGGRDILEEEALQCNEKYKISVTIENNGDFTENVSFDGSVDSLLFNHNPISDFVAGGKKLKTKTVNFTLVEGTYNILVEAFIEGFADENPGDNFAMREIFVSCND